jgi:SAM-dependent methyltransferase
MEAKTYAGMTFVEVTDKPHLGGNIKEGDPYTYCPMVWNYVIDRFCIQSVLDLGSGIGNAAHYFFGKGLKTLAVEGLAENVQTALYPTILYDLTRGPVVTSVDLVHCHEVAEHIAEEHLDNLISSLTSGRIILMTHALPGQGGYHHVNLKSMDYWVKHISERGYNLLTEDTNRIRTLAAQEHAIYTHNSGLLFHRK